MRSGMTRLSTTFAAVALAAGMGVQEPTGARSLFYNPATGSTAKAAPSPPRVPATPPASSTGAPRPVAPVPTGTRSVGVHYWIDLTGRGPVADTHSFASGDRIRIHVRTNVDGFLSVWALNTSGRASLLLPVDGDTACPPYRRLQAATGTPVPMCSAPRQKGIRRHWFGHECGSDRRTRRNACPPQARGLSSQSSNALQRIAYPWEPAPLGEALPCSTPVGSPARGAATEQPSPSILLRGCRTVTARRSAPGHPCRLPAQPRRMSSRAASCLIALVVPFHLVS